MTFFRDMKTSSKLITSFSIGVMFVIFLGVLTNNKLSAMSDTINDFYQDRFVPALELQKANYKIALIRIGAVQIVNEPDLGKRQKIMDKAIENEKETNKLFEILRALKLSDEEKKLLDDATTAWKVYNESRSVSYRLALEGNFEKARENAFNDASVKFAAMDEKITKLLDMQDSLGKGSNMQAHADYESTNKIVFAAIAFAIMISIAFVILLTNMIARPLSEATNVANKLANGDLTTKIEAISKDEVGQLLLSMKNMAEKLTEMLRDVKTAADNVSSGSQEMSSSSQQLSQGASEQASSIEETSAAMEQMSSNIMHNTDSSKQTEKIALKSAEDAIEGGRAVDKTVGAMKQIASKISIIEEIARQTNLLALNAAIEAARAGEHGKGFAVVASEVRKLAERSQTAAGEISQLSSSSVMIAEQAGQMLTKLVPDIQKTAELVQEISAASNEQNSGAEQINKAIQQLDQVIQQNASASEELAATSEELSAQSNALQDAISFFKIEEGGTSRRATAISKAVQKTKVPHIATGGTRPARAIGAEIKRKGVTLDMGQGGKDQEDSEFERY